MWALKKIEAQASVRELGRSGREVKDGQVPWDEREGELLVADKVDIGNLEEGVVVSANKLGVLDGLCADLVDVLWLR